MIQNSSTAVDEDLQSLGARICEMGGLAEEQLVRALEAVLNRDSHLAEEVIRSDERLDQMEQALGDAAVHAVALRQPVADDLREVIAAIKVASTLERIGDLAKNIARRAKYINRHQPLRVSSSIVRMGRQAQHLLSEVLDSYSERDAALAVRVWERDVEIDEMYNSLFRELITHMIEHPPAITLYSQLLFVAKNLERIGDHTTSIAEMTYYVAEGRQLCSERPKGKPLFDMAGIAG